MYKIFFLIILVSLTFLGCAQDNIINSNAVTNINQNIPLEVEEGLDAALTELQDTSAAARDAKRLADIKILQTALEVYKVDHDNYPANLEQLVDQGILNALPVNPTPAGKDYSYTPIGSLPAQYYDLCYQLEEDVLEQTAGYHCVSP